MGNTPTNLARGLTVLTALALLGACATPASTSTTPLVSDAPGSAGASSSSGGATAAAPTNAPPATSADTLATFTPPGANGAAPQGNGARQPARGARPTGVPGTSIRFTGGDGASVEHAIVIDGAQGETDGTRSEYVYLAMLLGAQNSTWRLRQQALLQHGGHQFDRLDVERVDGVTESFYFDITSYFGR